MYLEHVVVGQYYLRVLCVATLSESSAATLSASTLNLFVVCDQAPLLALEMLAIGLRTISFPQLQTSDQL